MSLLKTAAAEKHHPAKVLCDWHAISTDGKKTVKVKKGDVIYIIEAVDESWSKGRIDGHAEVFVFKPVVFMAQTKSELYEEHIKIITKWEKAVCDYNSDEHKHESDWTPVDLSFKKNDLLGISSLPIKYGYLTKRPWYRGVVDSKKEGGWFLKSCVA